MTMLTVVIPAYNEEDSIQEIVERVCSAESGLHDVGVDQLELLVVDDGSSDKTRSILSELEQIHPALRLICHAQNGGYGAALKTGFRQAQGELIGFLDADGTYPPEYFPTLCQAALNNWELVIGSRMAGAESQMPFTRRVGNIFFANLLSLMGRQKVTDSASGMRVFHKSILQRLSPLPDGLNLTPVMSTRAIHENIRIFETPIPYSERAGRSKLSVVHDGSLFLRSMLWTVLKYNPVRVLGLLGMVGVVIAGLVALWLVTARLSGVTTIGPYGVSALYVGAIAGFGAVSLLSLGVTFNYLVRLFHKQPVRQGLFGASRGRDMDKHIGWLGVVSCLAGALIGGVSLALGVSGTDLARLWLYFLGSGMFIMIGVQLIVNWMLLRVLRELHGRDTRIALEAEQGQQNIAPNALQGIKAA